MSDCDDATYKRIIRLNWISSFRGRLLGTVPSPLYKRWCVLVVLVQFLQPQSLCGYRFTVGTGAGRAGVLRLSGVSVSQQLEAAAQRQQQQRASLRVDLVSSDEEDESKLVDGDDGDDNDGDGNGGGDSGDDDSDDA